jgi:DNA-binding PadR family transcriptional regulator
MANLIDLPPYWPYLYASYVSSDFKFKGKTKLNKYVSRLQREGFPILNVFRIQEMGPLDSQFEPCIHAAVKDGLIEAKESGDGRRDYGLTEKGKEYVVCKIMPFLDKSVRKEDIQNSQALAVTYEKTCKDSIVHQEHEILGITNQAKFDKELTAVNKTILDYRKKYLAKKKDYCESASDITGMLEFIAVAFTEGTSREERDVGIRNIKVNAELFINELERLMLSQKFPKEKCLKESACLGRSEAKCDDLDILKNLYYRNIERNACVYYPHIAYDSSKYNEKHYLKILEALS